MLSAREPFCSRLFEELTEGGLNVVLFEAGTWTSPVTLFPVRLWARQVRVCRPAGAISEENRWS